MYRKLDKNNDVKNVHFSLEKGPGRQDGKSAGLLFKLPPSNFVALSFALLESVADPEGEFAKLLEDRDST